MILKKLRKPTKLLVSLFIRRTGKHYVKSVLCTDLNYKQYYLYEEYRVLLFKTLHIKETASSLNEQKHTDWYYKYSPITQI
jgi:hypothetical protein